MDLRELLGGGAVVCLGASFGALEYDHPPGDVDSMPGVSIDEGGARYSYLPGGGIDLVFLAPFSRVERACVTAGGDAKDTRRRADQIRSRLGGAWKASSSREVTSWMRNDAVRVTARTERPFTACVAIRERDG